MADNNGAIDCEHEDVREELTGTYCVRCDARVDGTSEEVLDEMRENDPHFGGDGGGDESEENTDDNDPEIVTDGGVDVDRDTETDVETGDRIEALREAVDADFFGPVTESERYADFKATVSVFKRERLASAEAAGFAFVFCTANDDSTFDVHFVDQDVGEGPLDG
jgi:hypothetical protein